MADLSNPFSMRVYWEDTDAGGVVFYANYLKFFERARTEWLRAMGIEQRALQETTGSIFVVADVALRYLAPAKLDDMLVVTVKVLEMGKASIALEQQAWRGEVLLAQGTVRVGCVNSTSLRPCRIPVEVASRLVVS
jgi:acyl-CoA thioester hydrolase